MYDTIHTHYGYGDLGSHGRTRFLIVKDECDGVYASIDILKCGWENGFIKPFEWCEYPELELAVATTIIRGA